MTTPVRITFRDLPSSPALLAHVERRASKLDTFYDRIVDCHVVLEEPHRRHRKGHKFHVRIEMNVPMKELVVSRTPADETSEDLHATIDVAFDDAERVLEDHARIKQPGPVAHERPPHGVVARIFHDRGYGFIEAEGDGHEVYFHKNSVVQTSFEKLAIGTKVRFAEEDGDKGPQASTVHVLHRHLASG
jgi:ribosomal subunit interface protein